MKLIWKLSIPQVCIVICLGIVSYIVIHSSFEGMRKRYVEDIVESKFTRIASDIAETAQQAVDVSSLFSQLPSVHAAYALAMTGDINAPAAPQSQAARELLRRELAPMLDAYKQTTGSGLRLHFHLPNGRSLVRLWRTLQTKVNGEWKDISDDLSPFRPTVLDVNRQGTPVKGIELGRGGFAVRGVVPVKDTQGRQLGSVEMLYDFDPILTGAAEQGLSEIILYMNGDLLPVATTLQDETKNPHVGDFVRVSASSDHTEPQNAGQKDSSFSVERYVTPELLNAGTRGRHYENHDSITLATFPVADYRGTQVGVLVCALRTDALSLLASRADTTLIIVLACMAAAPFAVLLIGLRALVTGPITRIRQKIQDIAEDRADLTEQIPSRHKDEIGDLARWFNTLTTKLGLMLDEMEGYVNVLNTVPDPIFVVDEDYRMLMANKATLDYLNLTEEELKAYTCHEQLDTKVCRTKNCPISLVKELGRQAEAETIELTRNGKSMFIKPSANILRDSKGHKVGYVEVARVVTDLVHSEREVNEKLERIRKVNDATREAAVQLTSTTGSLTTQFTGVQTALSNQQERLHETVTAMDQMNATVQQVAHSATEAAEQSQAAREHAAQGASIVEKSVQAILRVSEQATAMRESMRNLGKQAEEIGAVLGVISDIADQTNLLALNAAIEAARAGEAGRGFAVVADEVRKLAEKTMQATSEVEKAIGSIQRGAQSSIRMVDETGGMADNASNLATQSGAALTSIVELVTASSDQVRNIATAAEEQSATSEHINRAVDEVANMATDVTERMNASSSSVTELAALATRLDDLSKG